MEPVNCERKTAAEVHLEPLSLTDANRFEGMLLHAPEEPRWVATKKRKTNEEETTPVLSLVLADHTGPVVFDAWRGVARRILADIKVWTQSQAEPLFVSLERFNVRAAARPGLPCTPNQRKMVSTEKTMLKILESDSAAATANLTLQIPSALYLVDFSLLPTSPPFLANVSGVVARVSEEITASDGTPMKNFQLIDQGGRYILCRAFGRHVDNHLLVEGNTVAIFFTSALAGLSNTPGQLWIYDEAHVVSFGQVAACPPARTLMELQ